MSKLPFQVIIPARYHSTRLPGKPLHEIAGKPMIQRVYEQAVASGAQQVWVATDDARIAQAVENFGGKAHMTASTHQSGTDRIAEAAYNLKLPDDAIIVNIQGDEPLLPPELIWQTAQSLEQHPEAAIATLCQPVTKHEEIYNPHVVKVVRNQDGFALYFSRAPIPWLRDFFEANDFELPLESHYRHIGLYAYSCAYIRQFTKSPPAPLEQYEKLEQLRALYYGDKIYVAIAACPSGVGVDTLDDLEKVRMLFK